jgi:hypothetical protein
VYRNARIANAVTAVDHDGFGRGRMGTATRVSQSDFERATVARGPLPVTPGRDSLRMADREATVRPATSRGSERFFSNRQPSRIERVSFDEQRSGVERIARRSLGEEAVRTSGETGRGTRSEAESTTRGTGSEATRGWRRADEGIRGGTTSLQESTRETPATGRSADSEWRRFGAARVTDESGSVRGGERNSRFGEPATARTGERSTDRGSTRSDTGDWTRFSEGGSRSEGRTEPSGGRGDSGATWRRDTTPTRSESPRSEMQRFETPRSEPSYASPRSQPRMERRKESSRGESIRISPPIVRERGDSGSRGGGSVRSAPSGGGSRDSGGGMRSSPSGGGSRGGGESRGSSGGRGGRGR